MAKNGTIAEMLMSLEGTPKEQIKTLMEKYKMTKEAAQWALRIPVTQIGYISQLVKAAEMFQKK